MRRFIVVTFGFTIFFLIFFSPVLLAHHYLTWGDGLTAGLPAFYAPRVLWQPNIMLGNPWSANLLGYWYPLTWIAPLPGSFNAYMTAAYVIAAAGTFGLVRAITRSTPAGIVSGLVYALGGFMTSHSGHYSIVHSAAWSPWILWSMAELRPGIRVKWVTAGALSIAMCALAGQPQVLSYTMVLAIAYVVTFAIRNPHWRGFAAGVLIAMLLGSAMTAIEFIPAAELASNSVRSDMTFGTFIGYSNSPVELPIRLLFPYFLGVTHTALYPYSGMDFDTFTELSCYAGIVSLLLCFVSVFSLGRSREVLFWLIAALVALVASTGDNLQVGQVFYHIPLLNLYRAQGRHALEFTLAAAVLSGLGTAAIEQRRARAVHLRNAVIVVGASVALTLAGIAAFDRAFAQQVLQIGGVPLPLTPWGNPALGIPVLIFVADVAALAVFMARPRDLYAKAALVFATAIDLASFAAFGPLLQSSISAADLQPPAYVSSLRVKLEKSFTRVLSFSGSRPPMVLPPIVSLLWDLPEAGGHIQLEPSKVADLLQMEPDGVVPSELYTHNRDQSLNIGNVRYVALPEQNVHRTVAAPLASGKLNERVGPPSWVASRTVRAAFTNNVPATRIVLVSSLSDSVEIANGTRVADIVLTGDRGAKIVIPVLAGRDTSEVAYDSPPVRPVIRHARATVFSTSAVIFHDYVADFRLTRRFAVRAVTIVWRYANPVHGFLSIDYASLLDDATGSARAIVPQDIFESDRARWKLLGGTSPDVLFENRDVFPRAWIVHRVERRDDASALTAVRTGNVDFRSVAVVNNPAALQTPAGKGEKVTIDDFSPSAMSLAVKCISRCFLVTGDLFYPGWRATVDGAGVLSYRADYALRGVFVPPGFHRVRFEYRPSSVFEGTCITLAACLIAALLWVPRVRGGLDRL